MNEQIAFNRFTDVLNVDSINSTSADFLSTHVPFSKIMITNNLIGSSLVERISEYEVYSKYFKNSEMQDRHQLIVVDGSSGSGKSHFIRWVEAKLAAEDDEDNVVLMIRRSDNTLKGTIKQFLDIDEVKNIQNKDVYERLVKANQNVSEQKFKIEILNKFIVEISDELSRDNDSISLLKRGNKKKLKALLSSFDFEERMLMPGGPIDRIYSKIVYSNNESKEDVLALFEANDFILDIDFNTKLKKNASPPAINMADKLLPQADGSFKDENCTPYVLVQYMNSKVETVIKACAGLESGDFQQIFKEIRQELFRKGKNLILLIEDITSCTGINRDLLDALIINHTGEYAKDNMCRLLSVIGTTTEYFREFRDNYLNRITTMITIEDGAIGHNTDDLIQFVAKYLNVISLPSDVIDKWYNDGAFETEYPIHEEKTRKNWDYYSYHGKKISLYPFTMRAIINLYNGLDVHKTPRHIIRMIIEPAVDGVIKDKNSFPKFLFSRKPKLSEGTDDRIRSTIANMSLTQEERKILTERVFAMMSYWGDGTLDTNKRGFIGSVRHDIFLEFNLSNFAEKIVGKSLSTDDAVIQEENLISHQTEESISTPISDVVYDEPVVNRNFENFKKILSDWHYEKKNFTKVFEVRDELNKFISATIAWQREGVPLISVQMVENSSYEWVEIERQDKKQGKGLVVIEDNDETYQLLLAIGKSVYLGKKSWDFDGAASSLRIVTKWLQKKKGIFVNIAKGFEETRRYPDYVQCSIIAEIYRSLLNGDMQASRAIDIKPEILLRTEVSRNKSDMNGHSAEWRDIINNIIYIDGASERNIETVHKYFNLIQGNVKNSKKIIINYNLLEVVFKDIRSEKFYIDIDKVEKDIKITGRNNAIEYLRKILSRIERVAETECNEGRKLYERALKYFGYADGTEIETADIKDLLNEIIEFYNDTENYGVNITLRTSEAKELRDRGAELAKAFMIVSDDYTQVNVLHKLFVFSKNPIKVIKQFIDFVRNVDGDREYVVSQMKSEKDKLTRSGNWSDDVDPRFEKAKSEFYNLLELMEE